MHGTETMALGLMLWDTLSTPAPRIVRDRFAPSSPSPLPLNALTARTTKLFSAEQWKPVLFDPQQLLANSSRNSSLLVTLQGELSRTEAHIKTAP